MKHIFLPLLLSAACVSAQDKPGAGNAGQILFKNVCIQCHGPTGEGNETLKAPSIAGLPSWYVLRQLQSYRSGLRGGEMQGAAGILMSATAKALAEEHLPAVAEHVEGMKLHPAKPGEISKGADISAGKMLFEERCMECHRYNGTGEVVFGSPPLIGRQDWYLLAQIEHFKNGRRGVMKNDPNGAKMLLSSQYIESKEAARDLVAYIMTLNPAPETVEVENPAPVAESSAGGSPFDETTVAPAK